MPLPADISRLVEASLDATAVVDADLRLLAFNQPYLDLCGLTERDLRRLGSRGMCHERFKLDSCQHSGCVSMQALRTRRSVLLHQVRSGLGDLTLVVNAVPLLNEHGVAYAVVETYRDVTAEVRMQARFQHVLERERKLNTSLQQQVESRSAELSQARLHLVQLEKMGSLGLLVAGIAHELNNPIHFIAGNVGFLEEHLTHLMELVELVPTLGLPPEAMERYEEAKAARSYAYIREDTAKLLATLRTGAERVAGIVGDLRTFSHVGRNGEPAPFDLNAGLTTTLHLVTPEAKKRQVTLVPQLSPLPKVICVGSQINQVAMNLLTNAIQAAPAGGHVWLRTLAEGEGTVIIEVQDDGAGILEEHLSRIFDPFFTTKGVGEGTGLGLSLSRGIVTAHGGQLLVKSRPGAGATFQVRLPIEPPSRGRVASSDD